jgi:hypothetical protein
VHLCTSTQHCAHISLPNNSYQEGIHSLSYYTSFCLTVGNDLYSENWIQSVGYMESMPLWIFSGSLTSLMLLYVPILTCKMFWSMNNIFLCICICMLQTAMKHYQKPKYQTRGVSSFRVSLVLCKIWHWKLVVGAQKPTNISLLFSAYATNMTGCTKDTPNPLTQVSAHRCHNVTCSHNES